MDPLALAAVVGLVFAGKTLAESNKTPACAPPLLSFTSLLYA